jgi:hypothetical protein
MPEAKRFSLGVNYRPSDRRGASEADDFARMAGLGLDAVRIFVPWVELQPNPDGVDSDALDELGRSIECARSAGLRVLPTLAGTLDGADLMPAWTARSPFYTGPSLDAQVVLARAVADRLRGSAASIVAWDIGHEFSQVRPPRSGRVSSGDHGSVPESEQEVAAWSKALAQPFRAAGIAVTVGTSPADLLTDTSIRLGSLCMPLTFASLQAATPLPFGRGDQDPEPIPFLAMVASTFSFKPVLVTSLGTAADDAHASLASAILHRLHADGRLGAYWSHWRDDERGVIDAGGTERPVARALASFATAAPVVQRTHEMPMISSTYYYRTLPDSLGTLYSAYLGFVESRRLAP